MHCSGASEHVEEGTTTHPPMKSLIPCKTHFKKKSQKQLNIQIYYSQKHHQHHRSSWALPVLSPSAARGFPPPSVWGGAGRRHSPAGWSAPWSQWVPPPAAGASPLSASAVCPWRAAPPPAGSPSGGRTLRRPAPPDLRPPPGQQYSVSVTVKGCLFGFVLTLSPKSPVFLYIMWISLFLAKLLLETHWNAGNYRCIG